MEQRSEQWFAERRGKFTASEIYKLMGKSFGENLTDWPKTAQDYILDKVSEIFSTPMEEKTPITCQWGIDHEELARNYYEAVFKEEILTCGFIAHNDYSGCSPDGLVKGKQRGIEIKCPYTPQQHIKNFLLKSNDDLKENNPNYYWQVQFSMLVLDFNTWDYVSFHPNFDAKTKICCIEIKRNEKDLKLLSERLEKAVIVRNKLIENIRL